MRNQNTSFFILIFFLLMSVAGTDLHAQEPLNPWQVPTYIMLKTAPNLPFLSNDVNLAMEFPLGKKVALEVGGGYEYRNRLLFRILRPFSSTAALNALERGVFAEMAIKKYDILGDSMAYLYLGGKYQEKGYEQEMYDHSWGWLSSETDCFIQSSNRQTGTVRLRWGKLFPFKHTPLVFEVFGGGALGVGKLTTQLHQSGTEECDGPFIETPESETRITVWPGIETGFKLGLNLQKKKNHPTE